MKAEKQESGVLSAILEDTRLRMKVQAEMLPHWEEAAAAAPAPPALAPALRDGPSVAVIGEVKRRSPSAGAIRESTAAVTLAECYKDGGVSAISVLTEEERFGGSLDDLFLVAHATGLPTLRKDFIIDPLQVFEARAAGASAILLIVRALPAPRLQELASLAHRLGLATLIEVHGEDELETAIAAGPTAIGVNARDLESLAMDRRLHETLLPQIPADVIAVAESGLKTREDVERVAGFGADAVLVGTAVAGATDPIAAVKGLVGVRRNKR